METKIVTTALLHELRITQQKDDFVAFWKQVIGSGGQLKLVERVANQPEKELETVKTHSELSAFLIKHNLHM